MNGSKKDISKTINHSLLARLADEKPGEVAFNEIYPPWTDNRDFETITGGNH